jgi:hypothetical protein
MVKIRFGVARCSFVLYCVCFSNKKGEKISETTIAVLAERFVNLVLKHEKWDKVQDLPPDDVKTLFCTVSMAGFDAIGVIPGKLLGNYLDQDGSRTGETYPINSFCPFKVMDENSDNYFATGWLDCAVRRVVYGLQRQNETHLELIDAIAQEIERSRPLEPIQLTPNGDFLCEYPPGSSSLSGLTHFVTHTRDHDTLAVCIGCHMFCDGFMDRIRSTATHDAIICRRCHLRILFPKETKTYGDLRKALAPK